MPALLLRLATGPCFGETEAPRIDAVLLVESDLFLLAYESHPTRYYTLLAGDSIDDLRPIRMVLGRDGSAAFGDLPAGATTRYYAIEERRLDDPGDADGDGVDDVTELLGGTDPLLAGGPANLPPTVEIVSPRDGGAVRLGSGVTLTADAHDPEGDLTGVSVLVGGRRFPEVRDAPFAVEWIPERTGSFVVSALATDGMGAFSVAPFVTIRVTTTNLPPVVTLVAVPIGELVEPATVQVTVTAIDPDGTVLEAELFRQGLSLGVSTNTTFTLALHALPAGEHLLVARATDDEGAVGVSATVSLRVRLLTLDLPAGSRYISRELSVFNFGAPTAAREAISSEVSVYNAMPGSRSPWSLQQMAISRELSLWNFGSPSAAIEAISKEVSVYAALPGSGSTGTRIPQAISREASLWNFGAPSARIEAVSRETSLFNFGSPTARIEAIGREVSVLNFSELPPSTQP